MKASALVRLEGQTTMMMFQKSILHGKFWRLKFLPPSNEVSGKVMFSQASVILSTGEGSASRGVCIQEVGRPPSPPSDTTGYGQRTGGAHPTWMHSCFSNILTCDQHEKVQMFQFCSDLPMTSSQKVNISAMYKVGNSISIISENHGAVITLSRYDLISKTAPVNFLRSV